VGISTRLMTAMGSFASDGSGALEGYTPNCRIYVSAITNGNEAELSNAYPNAAMWRKLFRYRQSISSPSADNVGVSTLFKLPKPVAMAIQATLGVALSAPWVVPALADAASANTATQGQATPLLHEGDVVRLRSGGPPLTVKSVEGNWVICTWWDDGGGGFQTAGFPIAMIDGPVEPPSDDANPQAAEQKSPTEPSVYRLGHSSRTGQAN